MKLNSSCPYWSYLQPSLFPSLNSSYPDWPLRFPWKYLTYSCLSACAFAIPKMLFSKISTWLIPSPLSGIFFLNVSSLEKVFRIILFKTVPLTPYLSFLIYFFPLPFPLYNKLYIFHMNLVCYLFSHTRK